MFNHKNINLKLFSLTLFTAVGFYNANVASARLSALKDNSASSSIDTADTLKKSNTKLLSTKTESDTNNLKASVRLAENRQSLVNLSDNSDLNLLLTSDSSDKESAFDFSNFEGFSSSTGSSRTKTIRRVSFYLFLLLFVPFGIFYPFFLFYKKLLNNERDEERVVESSVDSNNTAELKPLVNSISSENIKEKELTNDLQAVVSQLQIACAVKDDSLRQKLGELCAVVDSRTDRGIAELMRKTISLLLSENEWTHVSCSSKSFPVNRIKTEFETICVREQSKFASEQLSMVGGEGQVIKPTANPGNNDSPAYIVVTLVLCTSHTEPLFEEIRTQNQLLETLSKLGKMRQDDLIKFDLLWNPQSEERYLTNNELLKNYMDMIRLF